MKTEDFYDEIDKAAALAHVSFNAFGWTYGKGTIPTHDELVNTITSLVDNVLEAVENDSHYPTISSGRFTVTFFKGDEEQRLDIMLNLADKSIFKEWSK